MQAFEKQEVPVAIETPDAELRTAEAGGMTIAFMTLKQGADFGPALQGLPDDKCPCPHWGYMLKGRLQMKTNEGEQVYEAGQAFYWGPGHSPVALEDCEYIDVSPTQEFQEVISHIQGG
jgi:hypothetical protein